MTARNEDRLVKIRALLARGLGVSDIARRLKISRQRASQLIHQAGYEFVQRLEPTNKKD